VKLLFDENLSPRLVQALMDLYPGSRHVTECGLRGAPDTAVWQFAERNGFVVVSKDSDFSRRSSLFGSPPKVIWLRFGNCTTQRIDFVLRNARKRIETFAAGGESCLVLVHPRPW
jgi:predicted nuclease of predicted toxin-antitoxin system